MTATDDATSHLRQERIQAAGRLLAVVLFVAVLLLPVDDPQRLPAARLAAVTVLMALLWLTQGIPIAATSLIPLALFPLLGIASAADVSKAYINRNVFLFLGGFVIALGIEKWGLHRRLALTTVCVIGSSPRRLVLGFMLATAFLSMWISNTASTLLMLPIGLALLTSLKEAGHGTGSTTADPASSPATPVSSPASDTPMTGAPVDGLPPKDSAALGELGIALMLGIAWAASIGGLTTLVGTPTNVAFVEIWDRSFVQPAAAAGTGVLAPELSAGEWMTGFAPIGAMLLATAWLLLSWRLESLPGARGLGRTFFRERLRALGRPARTEILMATVFAITAVLWVTRRALRLGSMTLLPGWSDVIREPLASRGIAVEGIHDSTVAMLMALSLFFIPAGRDSRGRRQFLMDWQTAERLPWGILLLIGGGFALAESFSSTGLSAWIGGEFAALMEGWPLWLMVGATCLLLTFLTELTSNVATISTLLPILAAVSLELNVDPRLIMFPAAIATSCAFMLPIATPPNAIVFGSGMIPMQSMIRRGILLNLLGVVILTVGTFGFLVPHFGIQTKSMPAWTAAAEEQVKDGGEADSGESDAPQPPAR